MKKTLKYLSLLTLLIIAFSALASCGGQTGPAATISPTSITASQATDNVMPGQSALLQKTVTPANANAAIVWTITEGASAAGISGDVLVVNSDAAIGTVIKVQAVCGTVVSNELTFTVGYAITGITASAIGSTSLNKGATGALNAFVTPSNASATYTWVIVEGSSYATIAANSNIIVIHEDAPTGATIKVRAVCGEIESNDVVFTVLPSQDEIQDELDKNSYFISLSEDSLVVDKKGSSAPTLSAEVYNRKGELIENMPLSMSVIKGAEFLSITQNGADCYFTALGHGKATVEVKIAGTDIVETADVTVIVPPEAIQLPEVFGERNKIQYAFSLLNHTTGAAETLPFVPTILGTNVCTDLAFTFAHESGATGDEVAVYENGAITFKMTGKVIVTVSSASGSKTEAKVSYTFDINDGYNVYTYAQLQQLMKSSAYNGQQINIVVLEKPDGSATNYIYGYELVPPTALKPHSEQSVYEILKGDAAAGTTGNRLTAANKSLYINGNSHKINLSQMRVFTYDEYVVYCNTYGGDVSLPNCHSILSAEPWSSAGPTDPNVRGKVYKVNLYNLEVVGNSPIDYDRSLYAGSSGAAVVGAFTRGINVGTYDYDVKYYIDADNLTASSIDVGMGFLGVVGNGKVSNIYAYNCYSTGVAVRSSIITLENLKFGPCGATGIELAAEECNEAGLKNNENQHVTISGTFDASQNLNSGNTNYFNNYNVGGATIPQIITGNVAAVHAAYGGSEGLGDLAVSHVQNDKGEFVFAALIFMNVRTFAPNTSEISYPAYMEGGIINIADLPTDGTVDTTHQFIRMPIYVTIGTGNMEAGSALFYNMHYGK